MNYLPVEVVSHIFSFLPSLGDRKSASLVCKLWYEAYQCPSLRKKEVVVISSNEVFDDLYTLANPTRFYNNITVRGCHVHRNTRKFWKKFGPHIRNLCLYSCDVSEKTFIKLLLRCEELESLCLQDCKELLMSESLLESENDRALLKNTLVHVTSLSLGYNRYLNDAIFTKFTSIFPNIKELLIPGCYISFHSGVLNRFYKNGHNEPSDKILSFSIVHNYIKANAARLKLLSFSETLIDCESVCAVAQTTDLALEKLYLRGCVQITNSSIAAISEYQIHLTHLDVSLCPRVNDDALINICTHLTGLKSLSIQGCRNITDAGMTELWRLAEIVQLNISECEKIGDDGILKGLGARVNNTLQELYMSHLEAITEYSISKIMALLPNLKILDLASCTQAITDRSIQSIFIHVKRLKTLIISMTDELTDRGVTGIALELPPNSDTPEARLRHLMETKQDFSLITDEAERQEVSEVLKSIDKNADLRGGCLRHLRDLQNLTLSGCSRVTDLSIRFGFTLQDLRVLDISSCPRLTDESLRLISLYNKSIEKLNLDNCNSVSDEGVGHVLKNLKRLSHLTLGSNKITDRILDYLGQTSSSMNFLDVRHCPQLSAATVNKIIAFYPRLHVVHFSTKSSEFRYTVPHVPLPPFRGF